MGRAIASLAGAQLGPVEQSRRMSHELEPLRLVRSYLAGNELTKRSSKASCGANRDRRYARQRGIIVCV
jgi:hypothetical protein